jgi:hypothetical protein
VLESKDTRHKFTGMGVDLLWVSLGHIKTPSDVMDKYTKSWGAKWHGEALKKQAEGNAYGIRTVGVVRTLARIGLASEMMRSVPLSPDKPPDFKVVLMQMAETLSLIPLTEKGGAQQARRTTPLSNVELALLTSPNASQLLNEMGFGQGSVESDDDTFLDDDPSSSI